MTTDLKSLNRGLRRMHIAKCIVAVGAISLISHGALADEGGVSFWLPGQYGSFAALPPETGFSMPLVT